MSSNFMKNIILYLTILSFFGSLISCKDSKNINAQDTNALKQDIEALYQKLVSDNTAAPDTATANEFIAKCFAYAEKLPNDTLTPDFLFKASDLSRGLGNYDVAMATFKKIEMKYPNSTRAGDALFMRAYILENELNNKEQAKIIYNEFLKKYPQHQLAKQVTTILSQIDKSPEELIKEFEQKSKSDK
ncbi:MAG: tetratricopeptide repeat protein [Saprospiraceae bacterium]|nr:tetratricopeptide repeat protein [Saprospiraceae bacterium]